MTGVGSTCHRSMSHGHYSALFLSGSHPKHTNTSPYSVQDMRCIIYFVCLFCTLLSLDHVLPLGPSCSLLSPCFLQHSRWCDHELPLSNTDCLEGLQGFNFRASHSPWDDHGTPGIGPYPNRLSIASPSVYPQVARQWLRIGGLPSPSRIL